MGRPKGNLGWRDSSNTERKTKKKQPVKKVIEVAPIKEYDGLLPFELLQSLLNIYKNSFAELFESDFTPILQEVKQHLFHRDFTHAFGRQDYLQAYAARWSPSRALGYLEIFEYISEHAFGPGVLNASTSKCPYKAVCFGGGGGAEVVALGGFLNFLSKQKNAGEDPAPSDQRKLADQKDVANQENVADQENVFNQETVAGLENLSIQDNEASNPASQLTTFSVHSVDIANWAPVIDSLHQSMLIMPPIYKYASTAAKAANAPLLSPDSFHVTSHQHDLLALDLPALSTLLADANLITLMFTLNELYSTSLSKTQDLLLKMTASVRPGAMMLVVDSPGSYSTVSLNGSEKNYPMQWLLDHTLLKSVKGEGEQGKGEWAKVESDESRWWRMPQGLKYPIDLENMRYQLHLFRKVG